MNFEWDNNKNATNIANHKISFLEAAEIFSFEDTVITLSNNHGNDVLRHKAIGNLKGKFYTVIFTYRGDLIRIISARRARKDEQQQYHEIHSI